jgi:hypothetical protein
MCVCGASSVCQMTGQEARVRYGKCEWQMGVTHTLLYIVTSPASQQEQVTQWYSVLCPVDMRSVTHRCVRL